MQRTALHIAVEENNEEVVKQLLSVPGIDINAKDKMGLGTYYSAMLPFNRKIIDLLLDHGVKLEEEEMYLYIDRIMHDLYHILNKPHAEPNEEAASLLADRFLNAKEFLAEPEQFGISKDLYVQHYAGMYNHLLKRAMTNKYISIVEKLIASIEKQENRLAIINYNLSGEPLLHYLMHLNKNDNENEDQNDNQVDQYEEQQKKWIETLLNVPGINLDIQDKSGCTLLHEASKRCNYAVAKLLLDKGARVDLQDQSGCIPFECVGILQSQPGQASDRRKMVELLFDHL